MTRAKTYALFLAVVLLAACKKDETPEPDLGLGYYPITVKSWVEYQVDSMWRDDRVSVRDSVSYRMLQRVEELYTDQEGRTAQRIIRYVKDEQNNWVPRDVWTGTRSNFYAELMEENKRRLKLSFPVREARTWDMNVYNTDAEFMVAFRDVDASWSVNGLSFPRTVRVVNTVPPNQVNKRNFNERYAHGVGLVSKYWEETNTQIVFIPQGPTIIEVKGWRLDMTAVAYGTD